MKKYLLSALLVVSTVGQAADEIQNIRSAGTVQVKSATASLVGEHGFPMTEVKAIATFGNSCEVPDADELVTIVNYSKSYDTLIIALGSESNRICPAVYKPVTVTINVGQYTRPNDGTFSRITVNQVLAKRQ